MRALIIAAVLVALGGPLTFHHYYPGGFCTHRPLEWAMHEGCLGTRQDGRLGPLPWHAQHERNRRS